LASCSVFIQKFAAGPDTTYDKVHDEKWIETSAEMREIIALLKSHGSEVFPIPYFDCEEYGLDIKFCISVHHSVINQLEEGENLFDRRIDNLAIRAFVFFEDVTSEELEKREFESYKCIYITDYQHLAKNPMGADDVEIKLDSDPSNNIYSVFYNGAYQFDFEKTSTNPFGITPEQIEILEKTVSIIE
jgi:hypothetical protein